MWYRIGINIYVLTEPNLAFSAVSHLYLMANFNVNDKATFQFSSQENKYIFVLPVKMPVKS